MKCKCSLCDNEFESPQKELEVRKGYGFYKDCLGERYFSSNLYEYKTHEKFLCRDCIKMIMITWFDQIINKVLFE